MIEKDHTIVGEELTLTVTMPPLCRAVVKEVGDSLCSCLQNFRALYEKRDSTPDITKRNVTKDADGKIFFTKCGNGDMRVRITRSDALPIDPSYIVTHQAQLHTLFQQLFECTDHFHVKE